MPGTQLNNYDLVVEFSEDAFNDLLSAFFDTISPIGDITKSPGGFSGAFFRAELRCGCASAS